jgi:hypothetical protein
MGSNRLAAGSKFVLALPPSLVPPKRWNFCFGQYGNYSDPEKADCEKSRTAFDLDGTIDRIAQSLQIK